MDALGRTTRAPPATLRPIPQTGAGDDVARNPPGCAGRRRPGATGAAGSPIEPSVTGTVCAAAGRARGSADPATRPRRARRRATMGIRSISPMSQARASGDAIGLPQPARKPATDRRVSPRAPPDPRPAGPRARRHRRSRPPPRPRPSPPPHRGDGARASAPVPADGRASARCAAAARRPIKRT